MTSRATLPLRRRCETFELTHGGQNTPYQVTLGYYDTNEIGEVSGSTTEAVARDGAVLLSIALQHGVPLETIKPALTREGTGTPSTIIGAVVDRLTEAKAEDEKSAQAET